MKNISFVIVVLLWISKSVSAQNYLPYIWKISFADTTPNTGTIKNIQNWQEANLLLSWERQGYFWYNGKCCLVADFDIPKDVLGSKYFLEFSLQCDVASVYLNGQQIGEKIPNSFWSNRGNKTKISIPGGLLKEYNQLAVFASNLSYTGGLSHNVCRLTPVINTSNSTVKIAFSEPDHTFNQFPLVLTLSYQASCAGNIDLNIKTDFHEQILQKTIPVKSGSDKISIDLSNEITKPGFYECTAVLHNNGFAGEVQWFSFSPEKISCKQDTIPGFNEYWQKTMTELQKVAPNFRMHKVDSLSKGIRDGYVVEMQSFGNLTIRGYYFVPRTPGKHAALLHVPGYGWGFDNIVSFNQSTENVIELALCVRGHGISADVFNPGFGIPGIWGWELCSKENNAYRAVYMDCLRAVDFLLSRPEVDAKRIGVMGGSQGGGLTLVTTGLYHDKIAACAYFDPFPCDLKDFINIRQQCQTEIKLNLDYYQNKCTWDDALQIQELINTKGFAHYITCPVYFATALFDDDCPSHIGFAAYNQIKAPKRYKVYPNDSHLGESDYYSGFYSFFKQQFGF